MEIITMESAAYKDIVGRIEEIASHVRKHNPERRGQETAGLLDSREVMRLLSVSRRTLQRLRDEKRRETHQVRHHPRQLPLSSRRGGTHHPGERHQGIAGETGRTETQLPAPHGRENGRNLKFHVYDKPFRQADL